MSKRLVIVGNGQMAELFCSNFTHVAGYDVAGFAVDGSLVKEPRLLGLPLVPLEEIEARFPPGQHEAFVAIGPVKNNAVRAAKFDELRRRGYRMASYVSPRAEVSPDATLGENVAIGHFCVVGPWARIGDNVLIRGLRHQRRLDGARRRRAGFGVRLAGGQAVADARRPGAAVTTAPR